MHNRVVTHPDGRVAVLTALRDSCIRVVVTVPEGTLIAEMQALDARHVEAILGASDASIWENVDYLIPRAERQRMDGGGAGADAEEIVAKFLRETSNASRH